MRESREWESAVQNLFLNKKNKKMYKYFGMLLSASVLTLLASCGDGGTAPTGVTGVSTSAASLQLSATSTNVPSDNSGSITITVTALDASNAALSGIVVGLSTDTGIVSSPTVTTGSDGTVSFTFRSGTSSLANRTATITASAGATAQMQVQIAGSTLTVFSTTGSSVPNNGTSPVTVTFIAKNAQGAGLVSTPYTATWVTTSGGQLSITPASGTTDSFGKFSIDVTGTGSPAVGSATLTATAAGTSASATITVTPVAGTFGISQTSNSTGPVVTVNPTTVPMQLGDQLTVTVSAPTSTNVTFVTSQGKWSVSNSTTQTVLVGSGTASAVLTQTASGQANVQVFDPASPTTLTDSLVVGITAVIPYRVALTASPTVVSKTIGTTTGTSTLVATVFDASGQPVGNAPVEFSMSNTTGGGESVSPVVAYTSTLAGGNLGLGQASTTFTSGSLSSSASGVQVRAKVSNTTVVTNTAPSSNDATIVIGGTAGSIAFGISTKLVELTTTTYQLPVSVLVADSNGNPQKNQTVTLSLWPIAWSTGSAPCAADPDGFVWNGVSWIAGNGGTFYNEDRNENLTLDEVTPGTPEDGYRRYYNNGSATTTMAPGTSTKDGLITPVNSAAGNIPSSVVTDINGVANFNLTYLKSSAIWTHVRMRASTVVQGTETLSQSIFTLPALKADTDSPCSLFPPYNF